MREIIQRVFKYSKTERIQRLIQISVKGDQASPMEGLEAMMIQEIRRVNGEIEDILTDRKHSQ